MIFKENLYNIMNELNNLPSKEDYYTKLVQEKLDRSYEDFNKNLQKHYNYLLQRDKLKVIKTIIRKAKGKTY